MFVNVLKWKNWLELRKFVEDYILNKGWSLKSWIVA